MSIKRRIFVSLPVNENLAKDPRKNRNRKAFKNALLRLVRAEGFEPQEFFVSGLVGGASWSCPSVDEVMRRCQGALIWAYPRWTLSETGRSTPSEYMHYEAGVAYTYGLPILTIAERGLEERGFIWNGAGHPILWAPDNPGVSWLKSEPFVHRLEIWRAQLRERKDVFLGYSSGAKSTADAVRNHLEQLGATVMDWARDFDAGGTILDEIERADRLCSGGIFLFTKDDRLKGKKPDSLDKAAPRDNVILEAGYFIKSKGKERVLIIREKGAKMPADVGGNIYLMLNNRKNIAPIKEPIRKFLENRL